MLVSEAAVAADLVVGVAVEVSSPVEEVEVAVVLVCQKIDS